MHRKVWELHVVDIDVLAIFHAVYGTPEGIMMDR